MPGWKEGEWEFKERTVWGELREGTVGDDRERWMVDLREGCAEI